jgi:hypothetical protein
MIGLPVIDPLFWLGLSILLVAVSLAAVLVVALPALQEVARAARSAEKLFDTLSRELPPTLQAIRLTGLEISDLTDEIDQGVQSAGNVAKRFDQSLEGARQQAQEVRVTTQSVVTGVRAAWRAFSRPLERKRRSRNRYPSRDWSALEQAEAEIAYQRQQLTAAETPAADLIQDYDQDYEARDAGSETLEELSEPGSNSAQQ